MNLFRQLTAKPWVTEQGSADDFQHGGAAGLPVATKTALKFFLAVVTILFFMLIVAYGGRMAFEEWRPGPTPTLLWQNTVMLMLSSVALQWAVYSAGRGQLNGVKLGLAAGGTFAFGFLTGQVLAWRQLAMSGIFEATDPAIAFFYLITGLHVLHLAGGMVAWTRITARAWGDGEAARIREGVELCAIYWHFLFVVWLVLFGLLFSGNNLNILLVMCGIK